MNKSKLVSSKKLYTLATLAIGGWLLSSCADTYDGKDAFDSGVRNVQLVSPAESDITITPNTDGDKMTITWPVVYGAGGYEVFLYPLIYAALGSIPGILIREKKEPTVKEFLIHQFIGVVMTSAIIIAVMFFGVKMTKEHMVIAAVNVVGVFVIYVLVNVITWILDSKKAESMTNDLKAFQEQIMKG